MLEVVWTPPPLGEGIELATERGKTRSAITHCTACPLHEHRTQPVPYSGPSNAPFAIMGEGPGATEDTNGEPFVGKSGKLLRAILNQLGCDPDEVFFFNSVSCFPNDQGKIRTPTEYELFTCRSHLVAQRSVAHTQYILLAGGTALSTFRSDLRISKVHGQTFVWDNHWVVMPIYHPSAALRGNRDIKEAIKFDLEMFLTMVRGELDPRELTRWTCNKCQEYVSHFDSNAVGYCRGHWEEWKNEYLKQRKRWTGRPPSKSGPIPGAISLVAKPKPKSKSKRSSKQDTSLF